jgi:uncharacterized protein (DUF885 family)
MKTYAAALLFLSCAAFGAETREQLLEEYKALTANESQLLEPARLAKLFDIDWRYSMLTYPEYATNVGYPGHDDRWTDMSAEAIEQRKKDVQFPLAAVQSIDRARLSPKEQLHYDLYQRQLKISLEYQKFPDEVLAIGPLGGIQQDPARMLAQMQRKTVSDYENILGRLRALPALVEQNIALLERGRSLGVIPPKITLRDVPEQIRNVIPSKAEESPLLQPFVRIAESISPADRERLSAEAKTIYQSKLVPAFQKLHDYVEREYLPAARESIAWSDLPQGAEWYAQNVRYHTTTDLPPQQIHDIGLREVARIRGEMDTVIRETGFQGSFAEFIHFLRTDKQFYFERDEDLLIAYRDICKRIDPELGRLFGKLPRLPYGVRPVPPHAQKSQTTAYYERGSTRTGRAGYFYANTHNLEARPRWEMEALTLHEAVPGHHLQIALAQELEGVPEWRKNDSYTAYVEGWGLYAESLGEELGLYQDLYQKFGKLTYEMWRACRLVVDTGMHALGWSRDRAIEYMREHSGRRSIISSSKLIAISGGRGRHLPTR